MPEVIRSQVLDEAGLTAHFARELEHVKATTYDVKRAPLKATELIPVDTSAGPAAEFITYRQYDQFGFAKVIANYADDLPRADVKGKEFIARVRSIGNSYGYSLQEIRASQATGKGLEARKAAAARRAHEERWNSIAFAGDDENDLQGLFTAPNVPTETVEAYDGDTEWAEKVKDQDGRHAIVQDLNKLANSIVEISKGVEIPDTIVLPIEQYNLIASTRYADGTDTTILQWFLQNNPYINQVEWANELKGAGATGTDRMWAYRRDPEVLTLEMPQMFEQLPVQERNLEFIVPCHSRIGGVIVYYPLAMAFADGI